MLNAFFEDPISNPEKIMREPKRQPTNSEQGPQ
jgi:hypothetical protein